MHAWCAISIALVASLVAGSVVVSIQFPCNVAHDTNDTLIPSPMETVQVSSYVGVGLAVGAGMLNAMGLNLQKAGLTSNVVLTSSYLGEPVWWTGFGLILASEACNSVAYGFAPASIVSALGATTVVFSVLLRRIFLGTVLTTTQMAGTVSVVVGCVLLSVAVPESTQLLALSDIARTFTSRNFVAFAFSTLIVIALLSSVETRRAWQLALLSALVSSWTVVCTRGIVVVFALFHDDCRTCGCVNTLFSPLFVCLCVGAVASAVWAGGVIEQQGLARFSPTVWVPIHYFACAVCFGVASAWVYDDFVSMSWRAWVAVAVGGTTCVWGILLVMRDA